MLGVQISQTNMACMLPQWLDKIRSMPIGCPGTGDRVISVTGILGVLRPSPMTTLLYVFREVKE